MGANEPFSNFDAVITGSRSLSKSSPSRQDCRSSGSESLYGGIETQQDTRIRKLPAGGSGGRVDGTIGGTSGNGGAMGKDRVAFTGNNSYGHRDGNAGGMQQSNNSSEDTGSEEPAEEDDADGECGGDEAVHIWWTHGGRRSPRVTWTD